MEDISMVTELPQDVFKNETNQSDEDTLPHNWMFLILIPMILATAFGNVLVCAVVIHVPKLQTVNNIFLMSLAVADLMVAVLVMPLGLVKDFYGIWPTHPSICIIWSTMDVFCCTASILHISVISLDRYLAISNPIRYSQRQRKTSSMVFKILLVWLTSAGLSSPLFILGLSSHQPGIINYHSCTIQSVHFKLYGSAVAFFLPLILVVATYLLTIIALHKKSRLFRKIKRRSSLTRVETRGSRDGESLVSQLNEKEGDTLKDTAVQVAESQTLNQQTPVNQRSTLVLRNRLISNERKANQVLLLVFAVFVLAWTPFFVVNIFFTFCRHCSGGDFLFIVLTWVGWASSMVNPIIYTTFNSDFRLAFWRILSCHCSRGCGIQYPATRSQIYSSTLQRGQTASVTYKYGAYI